MYVLKAYALESENCTLQICDSWQKIMDNIINLAMAWRKTNQNTNSTIILGWMPIQVHLRRNDFFSDLTMVKVLKGKF